MKSIRKKNWLAMIALAASLALFAPSANAQAPGQPVDEESKGRVFDGYFLTGIFAFAALFVVGKSSRRS